MKGITWLELGEPSKDDIKCTPRLTTEMGECRGCENSTSMPAPAKRTLNVLYLYQHAHQPHAHAQKAIKLGSGLLLN